MLSRLSEVVPTLRQAATDLKPSAAGRAPDTTLNTPTGGRRQLAVTRADLAGLRHTAARTGRRSTMSCSPPSLVEWRPCLIGAANPSTTWSCPFRYPLASSTDRQRSDERLGRGVSKPMSPSTRTTCNRLAVRTRKTRSTPAASPSVTMPPFTPGHAPSLGSGGPRSGSIAPRPAAPGQRGTRWSALMMRPRQYAPSSRRDGPPLTRSQSSTRRTSPPRVMQCATEDERAARLHLRHDGNNPLHERLHLLRRPWRSGISSSTAKWTIGTDP